jgi:hypothetical protein
MDASDDAHGGSDSSADAGPPPPGAPCDPGAVPETDGGLFVSAATGNDDAGSPGTRAQPFKTIGAALALATASGARHVYVDEGVYPEKITFPSMAATATPIVIEGGWKAQAAWARDCDPNVDPRTKTVVQAPQSLGVRASGVANGSGLSTLTVTTEPAPVAPKNTTGGSSVAVSVDGAGSWLTLYNVILSAGGGGKGGVASAGDAGASALSVGACAALSLPAGDGGAGATGATGTNGSLGSYLTDGTFAPGDGQDGTIGKVGSAGTAGGAGELRNDCVLCTPPSSCPFGGGLCSTSPPFSKQATSGTVGCPGGGGGGGPGGQGGGGSFALVVAGAGARVHISYSWLRAAPGGDGSAGGGGGTPAIGVTGSGGSSKTCTTT